VTVAGKIILIFGCTLVIVVISFIAYYFGMLPSMSRNQMRQKYLKMTAGSKKEDNTQGESLRQNFFTEEGEQ
tara:strand:+ start:789 stop:1004 length:216 start_codon:yes stop_codon:yes gene_type:complete